MTGQRCASVWDAIEGTPAEAENMKLRSALMDAIDDAIKSKGWTQAEAAKALGVTQPRVSALMRGKISMFSLDSLINMLTALGLKMHIRISEAA
ncbi:transcriptional regulator [Pleomorphomonas diazotrophica]|uniref:Transcriptional regulator n=1 Tax=Pleomorphomonas diazotrophica TaxID=1166257 RepID=A0A1I4WQP1_9HYPH|nr:XRE family transcriptional regulator [Pleomorphomonas diazotrophica]PKR87309.1 transcriptional regulator [Pleomorphomonas diazotrophica]SFN16101.1 Predicted DNA-binding protein, contains XRE-type HTH domain [Pleomorphomonas diazotrophica]